MLQRLPGAISTDQRRLYPRRHTWTSNWTAPQRARLFSSAPRRHPAPHAPCHTSSAVSEASSASLPASNATNGEREAPARWTLGRVKQAWERWWELPGSAAAEKLPPPQEIRTVLGKLAELLRPDRGLLAVATLFMVGEPLRWRRRRREAGGRGLWGRFAWGVLGVGTGDMVTVGGVVTVALALRWADAKGFKSLRAVQQGCWAAPGFARPLRHLVSSSFSACLPGAPGQHGYMPA
jgi:hypothetical protein